jgi:PAS domain S-box-containing protein
MNEKRMAQQKKDLSESGNQALPKKSPVTPSFNTQLFIGIMHHAPFGLTYHDLNGQITNADEKAQQILGVSNDKLKGHTFSDLGWCFIQEDGECVDADLSPPELVLETGKVVPDIIMGLNDHHADHYRWLLVSALPIFEPDNAKLHQVVCQISEISEAMISDNSFTTRLNLLQDYWQTLEANELDVYSSDDLYQEVLNYLPNVFMFPEKTTARIVIKGKEFVSKGFKVSKNHLVSDIQYSQANIGLVEFHYHVDQMD